MEIQPFFVDASSNIRGLPLFTQDEIWYHGYGRQNSPYYLKEGIFMKRNVIDLIQKVFKNYNWSFTRDDEDLEMLYLKACEAAENF